MADLYRKSSIEKLSNPEQLDRAIVISSPMSWLALVAVLIIIFGCGVWAFTGSMPEMKQISGVIVAPDYAGAVFADKTGIVSEITCRQGVPMNAGDTLLNLTLSNGESYAVTAPQNGIVDMVLAEEGAFISAGTELLRYSPSVGDASRIAVCYVPAVMAGSFKSGMKAKISPTFADSGKYGYMEGSVISVGEYPANAENLRYILGTGNLTSEMMTAEGAVVEVIMELSSDSSTASGFSWSNKNGKNLSVPNGTMITANVITEEKAPIARLFGSIE